uniref:CSON005365 protein n=1 Tax=Culicoides sonorensis TaxID=179676 RepID=A0A336MQP4_CULSO
MFPCDGFDANKSTKGASKLRRDLINSEIANLRDLLPLPQSTRQRLSQLQLMALICVYVRKANYFQQALKILRTSVITVADPLKRQENETNCKLFESNIQRDFYMIRAALLN